MNRALLGGLCQSLGGLTAVLDPGADRCCVMIDAEG